MAEIVASWLTPANAPLVTPADVPTIRIRRLDTDVLVVTDAAMTEVGDGSFRFTFATVATLEYSVRADGDPVVTGQVLPASRYQFGTLSGVDIAIAGGTAVAVDNLQEFIEGGRNIDFVGNDALGWQRIETDISNAILRRYNLFDETGTRINETVASFIARQGMISSEVAI